MKELKVAIFGCGKMGLHHIKAIGMVPGARVVAVADPHLAGERAKEVLPEGVQFYQDPKLLLSEARPDVVHVVTPPHTHTELAALALNHGVHVYVEKPFALHAADAETIVGLANTKGLKVCAGHQVLFQDAGVAYGKFMPLIGRVVHVESYFSFKTVRRSGGGGMMSPVEQLMDILPHPTYLMLSAFERATGYRPDQSCTVRALEVDPQGEVRAILQQGDASGMLIVTLRGRPIESYLRIVGTNGSINVDFVLSGVSRHPGPGASAISAVLKPFSQARQIVFGTISTIFRMVFRKHKSYAGLAELIQAFYRSILENAAAPVSSESIVQTVRICEEVGDRLAVADRVAEEAAQKLLAEQEKLLARPDTVRGTILVTGGTGFLGRELVATLRTRGWPVRVIARNLPSARVRVPGVEYVQGDVSEPLADDYFRGVSAIVHLAAETAGGKPEHERNTVLATQRMMDAAAKHGIKKFVHTSSIAVLKPSSEVGGPLNETSPMDTGNLGRGPYVWGKAESEVLVRESSARNGIGFRIIRLGPLVDFRHFTAPGRLGREVGPWYVAIGSKRNLLSVCDVKTAADVIRYSLEHFDEAPELLNLVEAQAPTRSDLVERLKQERPDLSVRWMPTIVLRLLSVTLKLVLKLMRPGQKPLDLYSAFASERYDNALAAQVIAKAAATDKAVA